MAGGELGSNAEVQHPMGLMGLMRLMGRTRCQREP
jgi:hypothetical protein